MNLSFKCKTSVMSDMQHMVHNASSLTNMCKTKERLHCTHLLVTWLLAQDVADVVAWLWPCGHFLVEVVGMREDVTRASTHLKPCW